MGAQDDGVSEIAAEIMIIALVLALGVIVVVMVFGVIPTIPKTSYLATESSLVEMPHYSAVLIHHIGGDALNFTNLAGAVNPAEIYVDTAGGSYMAVPDAGATTFQPGDTVYLYNTGTGYAVTRDLTGVSASSLPFGEVRVRIVDPVANLLIQSWKYDTSASPPTTPASTATTAMLVTTTIIPTPTATATNTATLTTTATATLTTSPTATPTNTATLTTTATVTPTTSPTATPTNTVTVSWSPGGTGIGCGSVSPPTCLTNNPAAVSVSIGSSQTFYFIPAVANKAVKTITLDGVTVYTGSSKGTTIPYTLTNVVSAHTLAATFG